MWIFVICHWCCKFVWAL